MRTPKSPIDPATGPLRGAVAQEGGDRSLLAEPAGDPDGRRKAPDGATIMIVDDEPTTVEVLEDFLRSEGYTNVVTTTDSRQALKLLKESAPDALLLDLMMPNVDGLEILGAIRSDRAIMLTPVLILTSATDSETKLKALELGANEFLSKPVDPGELGLRLRNTLAAKAYQDRLAYYDGLTGLPNRRLFINKMDRLLQRAKARSLECAVLHIDIDRFQQVNDAFGRSVGDALLKAVAQRLEQGVRPGDLLGTPRADREGNSLSRIGGDEFSLFLYGVGSADRIARVARRVLANLSKPYNLYGQDLFATCSIGIAMCPEDGESVESLLRNAEVALTQSKQGGWNGYQFHSHSFNVECRERLSLENQLRRALEREELLLHYQPKIDLRSNRIVGAEALMRWQHPELGLVLPERFIPIAEETDLIESLGEWALRNACRQNRTWQRAGLGPLRIAVNVSGRQFHPERFPEMIRGALQTSGLGAEHLLLELTESVLMENPEDTMEMLERIKELGLKIAIDDFGIGYSSMSYLKRFPLDEVKIDRSFVEGIPRDSDNTEIVNAIIGLAHSLGMTAAAEGVETQEQLAFLKDRGCDECQGSLFSMPVPASEWMALCREDRD